jgi:hypothetical protein
MVVALPPAANDVAGSSVSEHTPMTLARAAELLAVQADFGGFYNRNAARLILAEVAREHGAAAADRLIAQLALDRIFGFTAATEPGAPPQRVAGGKAG